MPRFEKLESLKIDGDHIDNGALSVVAPRLKRLCLGWNTNELWQLRALTGHPALEELRAMMDSDDVDFPGLWELRGLPKLRSLVLTSAVWEQAASSAFERMDPPNTARNLFDKARDWQPLESFHFDIPAVPLRLDHVLPVLGAAHRTSLRSLELNGCLLLPSGPGSGDAFDGMLLFWRLERMHVYVSTVFRPEALSAPELERALEPLVSLPLGAELCPKLEQVYVSVAGYSLSEGERRRVRQLFERLEGKARRFDLWLELDCKWEPRKPWDDESDDE